VPAVYTLDDPRVRLTGDPACRVWTTGVDPCPRRHPDLPASVFLVWTA